MQYPYSGGSQRGTEIPVVSPYQIPTTGRAANRLARQYGFPSLGVLALSLPEGATVIDVGAGVSPLGRDAALMRPDITWINIDACYDDPAVYGRAAQKSPDNLKLMAADITDEDAVAPLFGQAQRVYSYWLLEHLSLLDDGPARLAASHMLRMCAPGGGLAVGPVADKKYGYVSPFVLFKGSVHTEKAADEQEAVEIIVEKTRLRGLPRYGQLFFDRHIVPLGVPSVAGVRKPRHAKNRLS
jgi:hypothetical protein